jgi:disulfide bond formation protein DsbB
MTGIPLAAHAGGPIERYAPLAPLGILAASVISLGAAFIAQYGFKLEPCVLCIWQRWPYAATILLGLLAVAVGRRGRTQAALVLLAASVFLVGAAIAFFHVGVEQHWWAGTTECTGPSVGNSVEALRQQLIGRPIVRCDEVAFRFLGLSMAAWNFLASLAYAGLSFTAGCALLRRAT